MRRALTVSITLLLGFTAQAGSLAAQVEQAAPIAPISAEEAMVKLQTLIDQPAPRGLSPSDLAGYREAAPAQVSEVVAPRDVVTGQASGKRMHKPMTVIKEWGAFQQSIEEESVRFMGISNASKARHDIAMNAIRNLKG